MLSVVLITAGVLLLCFSFWLFLRSSDERAQRHFRSWWTARMTKEDAESARAANAAVVAVALMFFGLVLLAAGIAELTRLARG